MVATIKQHAPLSLGTAGVHAAVAAFCAGIVLAVATWPEPVAAQESRWALPDAGAPRVPPPPEHPTEAKAYATLDRLCAGCHQTGKLTLARPAGGFGHVLDLNRVRSDATVVAPANPDGSRLYTVMQLRTRAHEDIEVAAADLEAVRDWIAGAKSASGCPDRRRLTRTDDEAAIAAKPPETPLQSRHLSLRAAYNACASDADMMAYRHAVTFAVNSLSWSLKPVVLSAIDAEGTLLRVDLAALGWDTSRWQKLVDAYPYAADENSLAASPSTLRGEWFVAQALKAPLYYDMLGLPDRLQTLQSSLRIDAAGDVLQNRVKRAGVKTSAVARGSRLIQRHEFPNGGFWTTYEYAPTPGRADVFESPGGPGTRGATKADASLALFNLPSGYKAFFMANGDGLRLNELPTSVARNEAHPSQRLTAGVACLSCHARGVVPVTDELRARVQGDTAVPRDIRDKVLALHPVGDDLTRLADADNNRLADALSRSGLVPGAIIDGVDPTVALMQLYERDVTLDGVATHLGVAPAAVRDLAGQVTGRAGDLVERLLHGPVSRRLFEASEPDLVEALAGKPAKEAAALLPVETGRPDGPQLVIRTGAGVFKSGETLTVRVRTSDTCYLTLINVDRTGRGTVVFPNDFEQNNYLEAGRELRVPADGAPYVFRLRDPGRETVIGHCMTASKSPPGIRHDFERQRFTELGDYGAFLSRTAANEPEAKVGAPKAATPETKGSRRRGAPATRQAAPSSAAQKGEGQSRAAAVIEVLP